jgi:lipoprotein NlpI
VIVLEPNEAAAYYNRGMAKQFKGDFAGAIADYSNALEFRADNADAYLNRGAAKKAEGDWDEAIADFTRTIQLKPDAALAYYQRGVAEKAKGDLNRAMADFTKATELDSNDKWAFYSRGCLRYDQHSFKDALDDFQKMKELDEADEYAHARIWLVRTRLGDREEATKELQTYLENRKTGKPGDWASSIHRFLIGQLTEPDFLKAAVNTDKKIENDQHCEAYFYAGTKLLIADDKKAASDYFEKCMATGQKSFTEYSSAAAELKFLKAVQ